MGFRGADSLARAELAAFAPRAAADSLAQLDRIDAAFEAIAPYRPAVPDSFLTLARRAAELRARAAGDAAPATAHARARLALLLADNGEPEPARALVRDEWPRFARDPALLSDACYALGRAEHFLGNGELIVRSESLLVVSAALRARIWGDAHPRTGVAFEALGRTLVRQRKFAAAESAFVRANPGLDAYDGGPGALRAESEVWRGNYLFQQEAHGLARAHYAAALAIRERTLAPDDPVLGRSIGLVANAANRLGDLDEAQALYRRADAILSRADSTSRATLLNRINFTSLLSALGDQAEAEAILTDVLAHPERLAASPNLLANAHSNLANALAEDGRAAQALPHYAAADSIGKTLPVAMNRVRTLTNWGNALAILGRYDEAEAHISEGLAIADREIPEGSALNALVLDDFADLRCARGDFAGARPLVERALAFRDSAFSPSHPLTLHSRLVLARVERGEGHPERAADIALDVERMGADLTRLIAGALADREALAFARVRPTGLPLLLDLLRSGELRDSTWVTHAWEATVAQRALVLDGMAGRARASAAGARAPGDTADARLLAGANAARADYAHLLVGALLDRRSDVGAATLDAARRRSEAAERAIAARWPAPARADAAAAPTALELTRVLEPGAAIVSLVRTESWNERADANANYVAFVARAGGNAPRFVDLGSAAVTDSLFGAWYALVRRGAEGTAGRREQARERALGRALRARVLDPLAASLAGVSEIDWIPDGALQLLNVTALPSPHGDRFVVEEDPLFRLFSTERDLLRAAADAGGAHRLLVIGGVDYERARTTPSPAPFDAALAANESTLRGRAEHFAPLPASLPEARDVAALWQQDRGGAGAATILTGVDADERSVRSGVAGCQVVHLCAHGFVLAAPGNPLELSGIALAGANRRALARSGDNDGILTAQELAALDLASADWLVLSGCETGRGDAVAGEGVLGMRRAGMIAGARTVIVSLWPVEDVSSRLWMRELYEARFARGRSTAEAVRDASRRVLSERRRVGLSTSPSTWGAFVAVGD